MKKQKSSSKPASVIPEKTPFLSTVRHQALFIFFLSCILYVNTLSFDYNLDDGVVITGNKFTKQGFKGISDILSHDTFYGYFGDATFLEEGRYRPLTQILFAVLYQFFGLNPFIGHLMNVLFYAGTCLLLFFLLRKLFDREQEGTGFLNIPFITAALFTAHPLHTEVVANIKGMDEIASLCGALITLWMALRFEETKKKSYLLWMFLSFFLALLSKENALTFFAVIPLTLFVFRSSDKRTYLLVLIPLFLGFAAYMGMRFNALGHIRGDNAFPELLNDPFLEAGTAEKYATILYTWGKYLLLLIFPHPLTHDYYPKQVPIIGWDDLRAIIPLVICLGLLLYAIILIRKKSILSYAILFFVFTFSISSNLIVPVGTFMNERFVFSASIGFCMIIAWLLADQLPKLTGRGKTHRNTVVAVLVLLLTGYSFKTISRNPAWKDGYTLFTTDVKISTNSAKVNTSAGGLMMEKAIAMTDPAAKAKLLDEAMVYMKKAVEIHPRSTNAWLIIGRAEIERKNYEEGKIATENCLRINPRHGDAYNNMRYIAQEYRRQGKYESSVRVLKDLLQYRPGKTELLYEMAMDYKGMGRTDSCIKMLHDLTVREPSFMPAFRELGEVYAKQLNDIEQARTLFLKAHELDPNDVTVLENLGVIYGMRNDFPESIRYFEAAIRISPQSSSLYRNLAASFNGLNQPEKAQEALAKAIELEKTVK